MPLLTRCIHCGHSKPVPEDFLGAKARCPKCRKKFIVVLDVDQPTSLKPPADPTAEVEATTPIEPLTDVPPADPISALEPIFRDEPPQGLISLEPQPVGRGVWAAVGLAAVVAVGAGVSAAVTSLSFLVIPLAAAGAVLGGVATLAFAGRPWLERAVPGLTAGGSALLLLLAVFAPDAVSPQYAAGRQASTYDPTAVEVVPVGGELVEPQSLGSPAAGVDANRAAVQQGPVRVRVTGVTVGPVELATATPSASAERYLTIGVHIQHVGHGGPVTFAAWGAAVPKSVPAVRLTRGGKPVREADLGAKAVRGKLYHEHALTPNMTLTTKLVFEVPAGPPEPLLLELPAEAWGRAGVFRFRIPAATLPVTKQ